MDFICMHNEDDEDCVRTNRALGMLRSLRDDTVILVDGKFMKACTEVVQGRALNIENGTSHVSKQTTRLLELILIVSFLESTSKAQFSGLPEAIYLRCQHILAGPGD